MGVHPKRLCAKACLVESETWHGVMKKVEVYLVKSVSQTHKTGDQVVRSSRMCWRRIRMLTASGPVRMEFFQKLLGTSTSMCMCTCTIFEGLQVGWVDFFFAWRHQLAKCRAGQLLVDLDWTRLLYPPLLEGEPKNSKFTQILSAVSTVVPTYAWELYEKN